MRRILDEHNSKMMIVAKIENMQGIKNLDEIIDVSDGIMVARGDMGVEVPLEEVPVLQIAPGSDGHILGTGTAAGDALVDAGTAGQVDHVVVEGLSLIHI